MRRRLGRDPLLKFLAIGGLIFAVHAAIESQREHARSFAVDPAFVEGLAREQTRRTGIRPTAAERDAVVRAWVRQQVLYREGVALGFDRADPVVERRVALKMELWLASEVEAELPTPDSRELARYAAAHAERYRDQARTTFDHAFFARSRGPDARERAAAALAAGVGGAGEAFPYGRSLVQMGDEEVARIFGAAMPGCLAAAPLGRWSGPCEGAHGAHLVRVHARRPAALAPLSRVRARVLADYREEARRRALDARIAEEIARYEVTRP